MKASDVKLDEAGVEAALDAKPFGAAKVRNFIGAGALDEEIHAIMSAAIRAYLASSIAEPVAWYVSAPNAIMPEPRVFQVEAEADKYLADCLKASSRFTKRPLYAHPLPAREVAVPTEAEVEAALAAFAAVEAVAIPSDRPNGITYRRIAAALLAAARIRSAPADPPDYSSDVTPEAVAIMRAKAAPHLEGRTLVPAVSGEGRPITYARIVEIVNDCSERMKKSGESHRMMAKWISEGINAALSASPVPKGESERDGVKS